MDKLKYASIGFIIALVLCVILHFAFPYRSISTVPYNVTKYETTYVKQNPIVKEDLISKAKLKALDAKYQNLLNNMPKNIDIKALQEEANQYWYKYYQEHPEALQGAYTAQMDSLFIDSSIVISSSYISPIPLHPKGYFLTSYQLNPPPIRTVKEFLTVAVQEHWYNHFGMQFGMGTVYSQTSKQFTLGYYLGFGYSYNF